MYCNRHLSFDQYHNTNRLVMQSPFAKAGLCLGQPAADKTSGTSAAERYAAAQLAAALQSGRHSKTTLSSSMMQIFTQQRASQTESSSSSSSPDAAVPRIIDVTALCSTSMPISSRAPAVPQPFNASSSSAISQAAQARSGSLHHSPSPSDLPLSRQKRGGSQQLGRWPAGTLCCQQHCQMHMIYQMHADDTDTAERSPGAACMYVLHALRTAPVLADYNVGCLRLQ